MDLEGSDRMDFGGGMEYNKGRGMNIWMGGTDGSFIRSRGWMDIAKRGSELKWGKARDEGEG